MPESKQYETSILIGGKIDPALRTQLKSLGASIKTITTNSKEMGKSGKENFELFKKSAEGATEGVEALKDAVGELLLPILGVTAAFSSIKGIFGTLDSAAEKFEEIRNSAASFKAVIAGTDYDASAGAKMV